MEVPSLGSLIPALKRAVDKLDKDPKEAERYIKQEILPSFLQEIDEISYNLRCLRLLNILQNWYDCLLILYEGTNKLRRFGYKVIATVEPEGSYTFEIDLTSGDRSCVCPRQIYFAALGSWVTFKCIVNENVREVKSGWRNKWAPPGAPCPTYVSYLTQGDNYVRFPKRKVKDTWSNEHTSESSRVGKYADYLDMNFKYASDLITHVYEVMVDELEKMIRGRR